MWLLLVWARLPVFFRGGSIWYLYLLNFYKENDFIYNKQKKREKSEWVQQVLCFYVVEDNFLISVMCGGIECERSKLKTEMWNELGNHRVLYVF